MLVDGDWNLQGRQLDLGSSLRKLKAKTRWSRYESEQGSLLLWRL
jgi:hypothetical protein